MRCIALIPAAGAGSRAGSDVPKQYLEVAGKPMIVHTIEAFAAVPAIERIVVVITPEDRCFERLALSETAGRSLRVVKRGGQTRGASVRNGLEALRDEIDADPWILVHDAARCGITPALIETLIEALGDDDVGGLLAVPVADTLKRAQREVASRPCVDETVERSSLWQAQTPQMFRYRVLCDALAAAHGRGLALTDEAGAIEAAGGMPRLVTGSARNFKVTTADDLAMMDALLGARSRAATIDSR